MPLGLREPYAGFRRCLTVDNLVWCRFHSCSNTIRIQRSRYGLADPNRPIASCLFLGPTGVGGLPTHLCGGRDGCNA